MNKFVASHYTTITSTYEATILNTKIRNQDLNFDQLQERTNLEVHQAPLLTCTETINTNTLINPINKPQSSKL